MKLNYKKLLIYQQNRKPYLLIDEITKVIPGKISEGKKKLKNSEWFFKVHWKNNPNMPGMLQIEAIVQTGSLAILTLPGNKGKFLYLISANNLKFYKKVIPGDTLIIKTKLINFKRGIGEYHGEAIVKKKIVSSVDFKLLLPDEIKKYSKKN